METGELREIALDSMPEQHREKWNEGENNLITRALAGCGRIAKHYGDFYIGAAMMSYNNMDQNFAHQITLKHR